MKPRTLDNGVRSSWLTVLTSSDFIRSSSYSRVMSRWTNSVPKRVSRRYTGMAYMSICFSDSLPNEYFMELDSMKCSDIAFW
ncbi:hypothetical protein D3C85_1658420 [compost metagenome]